MGSGVRGLALASCCVTLANLLGLSELLLTSGDLEWESFVRGSECQVNKAYKVLSVRLGTEG